MKFSLLGFLLFISVSCVTTSSTEKTNFSQLREQYFLEFLRRNPVVCTYLGGEGYSPELAVTSGQLRDWSAPAIAQENSFYRATLKELEQFPDSKLSADEKIDREVIKSQIQFLLRLTEIRRHQLRCVEAYSSEPARGIDWAIQGMTSRNDGGLGTEEEWKHLVQRVGDIPRYLSVAGENLAAGVSQGVIPDVRMIEKDGISVADANAKYFSEDLPKQAQDYLKTASFAQAILQDLESAGQKAKLAYLAYKEVLGKLPRKETFAMGESEYNWALKNNLHLRKSARELFDYSAGQIVETQRRLVEVAKKISDKRGLNLPFRTEEEKFSSVRAVMNELGKDSPKSDDEMLSWCKETAFSLVEYAKKHKLFDLPASYKLDIVETPPQLRSAIEAAYYPAPPFKKTGVGRFYVTPTGNDPALLKDSNRHSLADLCAHEGFPGHDWNYQYMNAHSAAISNVRWLTPGGVEDTCSMWEDSMAAEGWALYAEELMAEPKPGMPDGYYSPEERLYQLNWQLLRDVRVRVDTGIHTGALSFDQAVDFFAQNVNFVANARAKASSDETARAALTTAERAIYRYSKWPTQAICYHLGKKAILELRAECAKIAGAKFSSKRFHELFMEQGTIPPGYFRERLLEKAKEMVE